MPLVSFVLPVYNEEATLPALYDALRAAMAPERATYSFEIVFVNDGSADRSLEMLLDLQHRDDEVRVVNFSRNFGHQIAISAGIDLARGDAVIVMDSDLQDPPAVSRDLLRKWEEGYHVVYAQRRTRQDTAFKKVTADMFYRLLDRLSEIQIPRSTGDFRLLDRRAVEELKKFREHNRYVRGLVSFIGFRQTGVLFDRDPRYAGKTGYPLGRMIKFAIDGLTGFSTAPLRLVTRVGFLLAAVSFAGAFYAVGVKLFDPSSAVPGWAMLSVAICFLGGIQLLMLGIVGGYVGRIYIEVQGRPLYIVESVYQSQDWS